MIYYTLDRCFICGLATINIRNGHLKTRRRKCCGMRMARSVARHDQENEGNSGKFLLKQAGISLVNEILFSGE